MTMVHGSEGLLEMWIDHYARHLGREHLVVLSHGEDPRHRALCAGLNHIVLPRVFSRYFERDRAGMVTDISAGLLRAYRAVIFTDVDEFITLDPRVGTTLPDYLSRHGPATRAPIGFNIVPGEAPDTAKPLLRRHPEVVFSPFMCKPVVQYERTGFVHGFHGTVGRPFVIDPNLVLFHAKYVMEYQSRYAALQEDVDRVRTAHADLDNFRHWQKSDDFYSHFLNATRKNETQGERHPAEVVEGGIGLKQTHTGPDVFEIDVRDPACVGRPFLLPEIYRDLIARPAPCPPAD